MMEYTYYTTFFSMCQAIVAGMIWGIYYDAFRILRRLVRFDRISIALQDLFFWMTSAVIIFFVCVKFNNGFIRIYFVVFAIIGWALQYVTLGRIAFTMIDFVTSLIHGIIIKVKKRTESTILKIYIKYKGNS